MTNLVETGRGQPSGPEIEFPPEAKIELDIHGIDREIVIAPLTQWWEEQLVRCRDYYAGAVGYSSSEVATFLSIPEDRIDFETDQAEIRVTFSSAPGAHRTTNLYGEGELEIFLAHLYPTIKVQTLWCRSQAPIQCAIYLKSPDGNPIPEENIEAANKFIELFAKSLNSDIEQLGEPRVFSWFRDFLLRTRRRLTSEEMSELVRDVRAAAEAEFLQKPAAEAEHLRLEGAAELLKAIGENNAVVQLGRVLLVKRQNETGPADIVVRTLSEREYHFLQQNEELLYEPQCILEVLAERREEFEYEADVARIESTQAETEPPVA